MLCGQRQLPAERREIVNPNENPMFDESTVTYVDVSVVLRISSEPVTEDVLVAMRDALRKLLEETLTGDLKMTTDHDVELSYFDIDKVTQNVEREWHLEFSDL
jgi:hypothetical protein